MGAQQRAAQVPVRQAGPRRYQLPGYDGAHGRRGQGHGVRAKLTRPEPEPWYMRTRPGLAVTERVFRLACSIPPAIDARHVLSLNFF